eukprot:gi/632982212/ref/XP_007908013.1/ PREDICTED: interleukin-1 receptor type 2-like [Callorhinchus milii]
MIIKQNSSLGPRGLLAHSLALLSCLLITWVSGELSQPLAPKILIPRHKLFTAQLGQYLEVPCQALTSFSDSFSTIIYWLANQEFIEDKFTDMRVRESNERVLLRDFENNVDIVEELCYSLEALKRKHAQLTLDCGAIKKKINWVKMGHV